MEAAVSSVVSEGPPGGKTGGMAAGNFQGEIGCQYPVAARSS
jgi:hypothetical protein